jgi:voltage-gated potassium channel
MLGYLRRNSIVFSMPLIVMIIGTLGYHFLQGLSVIDAIYMTAMTITTVGYREVGGEPGDTVKVFTIFMMFAGISTVLLAAGKIGQDAIVAATRKRQQQFERQVKRMQDHYILCGYGRMGRVIAQHLKEADARFVVVDADARIAEDLREQGIPVIHGDAASDDVLEQAAITRAKGFVSVLSTDALNVFAALTARQMNPSLFILTRANNEDAVPKLYRAGASKVVNPYDSAGSRIAEMLLRPVVYDFMQIFSAGGQRISIEEIQVQAGSRIAGKALRDSDIRKHTNAIIVAVKTGDERMKFNPSGEEIVKAGDILVAIAEQHELDTLADMAK